MKKTIFSGFVLILAFTAASSLQAQTAGTAKAKTLSPELVGQLTKGLSIKPEQAIGGAGALFGLAKTRFADATCGTIRMKILKIGAFIRVSVRRIKFSMASAFPYTDDFAAAWAALDNAAR